MTALADAALAVLSLLSTTEAGAGADCFGRPRLSCGTPSRSSASSSTSVMPASPRKPPSPSVCRLRPKSEFGLGSLRKTVGGTCNAGTELAFSTLTEKATRFLSSNLGTYRLCWMRSKLLLRVVNWIRLLLSLPKLGQHNS